MKMKDQLDKTQPDYFEESLLKCHTKFNTIIEEILSVTMDAHKIERSIFKHLLELGLLLLNLYFSKFNNGNYGETINTIEGEAVRGDKSDRKYFSIFGIITISRYLYHVQGKSLAILDIILNLPKRRYSYFLSELTCNLTVNRAYSQVVNFLKIFFYLKLSVSAAETIVEDTSCEYEEYYSQLKNYNELDEESMYTVVSFDGKGVPMIKKEAAKIISRLGKGEKRQKKKEALVGVKYNIAPNIRTAEEVAKNLIYPEEKKANHSEQDNNKNKAQNKRYIASIEKSKKQVMEEVHESLKNEDLTKKNALICVMDGALVLWKLFEEVFSAISNKIMILDIIHVVEYIWKIANVKYKEGSKEAKKYVYKKLKLILEGKVLEYIEELERELKNKKYSKTKRETISKVLTYLNNHIKYMKYDEYIASGYPIASGVVESACGHIVKDRMEISGARWGIKGGEKVLKLRSIEKSDDWEKYFDYFLRKAKEGKKALLISDDYYETLKLAA